MIDISLCTKLLVVIKISLVRRGTIARQQATVMSFADVFVILTALFVVLTAFGILMRRPEPLAAGADGH